MQPAVNPAPAGYGRAAVWMDMCAPGGKPSPCWLQNSYVSTMLPLMLWTILTRQAQDQ